MHFRKKRFLLLAAFMVVCFVYIDSILGPSNKSVPLSEEETSYSEKSLGKMKDKLGAMEKKFLSWKALDDYNFMEDHFYDAVLKAEPVDTEDDLVQIDQTDKEDVKPWKELEDLNKRQAEASDPHLVAHLRKYWIYPPCTSPYILKEPEKTDHSLGQSTVVDKLLKQQTGGVFVECGAMDGETMSNSLFFETQRQWRGLLIEPGPVNFRFLKNKHRKAYTTPSCVGLDQFPKQMSLHRGHSHSRLIDSDDAFDWIHKKGMMPDTIPVQCFPLYSLLLAANFTTVDYLSLDVSGLEFNILQTLPFKKLDIKVISVECSQDKEGPQALQDLVESKGYTMVDKVETKDKSTLDYIFLNDNNLDLLHGYNQ